MNRLVGTSLVAGSAVAYSLAGYFTRLIPLDVMTLLFWRGIVAGLTILAVVAVQERGAVWPAIRATGWTGLLMGTMATIASYLYLAAFRHTTVADVSVIYATLPFVAAGLGWLLLRERESRRVLLASGITLLGVAVMASGAIGAGHLLGDLLAFGMTLTFALTMVLMRRGREVSMLPAVAVSCFLTALVAWPFAKTGPVADLPIVHLVLFGATQLGLGLILLTLGMRRVESGRAAVIGLLDAPLAPVWVWLAFDEAPPTLTLVGGGIVMVAVLWNLAGSRSPAVPPAPQPS